DKDEAIRDALMYVPAESAVVDSDARLPTIEELGMPALERSVASWEKSGRPEGAFSYKSNGEPWLAGFEPYRLGRNTFWIGVALPERDLLAGGRGQRMVLLLIVLGILVIGLIRATALVRRFSRPIEGIVKDMQRIREGDLEPSEPLQSNVREFKRLVEAQDSMREGLKARKKLDKIEHDLGIAREIQHGLLPQTLPDTPGYLVQGWSRPADQTGGDYFDWLDLPDGRTLFTLADVTGHGIGPALIVAFCRAYMRAAAINVEETLACAMSRINDLLCEDIPDGRFVTAAIGVLDAERNEMAFISAGQAPIYFHRAAGGETETWGADEMPLGITPGIAFGKPRRIHFEPGDALVLTTDGFFEWANADGDQFGMARLKAFIDEHIEE
ncbi:MAG: SpoIIE family protein phosphatase, partial [Rhodospirillales bacterium]|nr:SpoIIE family protein phosphatase [Rhodospirillales bacterium]